MTKTSCNLETLPCGEAARIESLRVDPELQGRFGALGLEAGRWVQVLRRAGLGGPLHVRVGSTEIILRRQEAACILVGAPRALAA